MLKEPLLRPSYALSILMLEAMIGPHTGQSPRNLAI